MTRPTVSVIVHSYNRPAMLAECLASVAAGRPDEIIVADDGSTFDVAAACAAAGARLIALPPMTPAQRMRTPRQGPLIHRALELAHGDLIAYLCDDDLHHPGWYDALRAAWEANPALELVRGDWLVFDHGGRPSLDNPPCPLDPRGMTAGNFAHHARVYHDRGARWPNWLNCLDHGFLVSCHRRGIDMFRVPRVGLAGWRREHPKALVHHTDGRNHLPSLLPILEGGYNE